MADKMLIDASHEEETRVVVVRGNRIEEFDFESQHKKQLRGNIYLAKVTRVEPSLQAAFVDYGGNRHGFLAFSEIHPDYYQIPLADRQALLEAEAAEAAEAEAADNDLSNSDVSDGDEEANTSSDEADVQADADAETEEKAKPKKRRSRRKKPAANPEEVATQTEAEASDTPIGETPVEPEAATSDADIDAQAAIESPANDVTNDSPASDAPVIEQADQPATVETASDETADEVTPPTDKPDTKPDTMAAMVETDDEISESVSEPTPDENTPEADDIKVDVDAGTTDVKTETEVDAATAETIETTDSAEGEATAEPEDKPKKPRRRSRARKAKVADPQEEVAIENSDETSEDDDSFEQIGAEDAMEEVPIAPRKTRKQYRIQEVIKRRQILLVQIVKEERGNKGAALTTYMSLAGRYSVLMPNTARGGGISRKITNVQDRKRLKEVARELEVPQGMGVILRTAGASRTKTEIRRDFEYLMRLWENVRNLTLNSTAPCLVYEEGSLIKRSVRDLYNKDISEVIVSGEDGYREAKDFMKMLMPSHAKAVQPYRGARQLFVNYGIEAQLDQMMTPQVTLKSGGYLIINQTEALVAVDVNSGRSTRENSIEDTALATNLEAAEEVSRQLRLRDLAGLVVIDFIDMEEKRNNRAVEKRLKDFLKHDRARIQVGRISHFGLLEMSRQRIRASVLESTTATCPHCEGTGHMRSDSSLALHILRAIEEQLLKAPRNDVNVRSGAATALYILNQKRDTLSELEQRFGITITFNVDPAITSQDFYVEKGAISTKTATVTPEQLAISSYGEADAGMLEEVVEEAVVAPSEDGDDDQPRKKRRRRRRRGRGNGSENSENQSDENSPSETDENAAEENSGDTETVTQNSDDDDDDDDSGRPKKRRRRGKRGGRKNRERDDETEATDTNPDAQGENTTPASSGNSADAPVDPAPVAAPADIVASVVSQEAPTPVAASDETSEAPKKPRRRRTTKAATETAVIAGPEEAPKAETVPESSDNSTPAPTTASSNTEDETPKPDRQSRTNIDAIASEPVVTSSASPSEDGDGASKKTGWWRRAFKG